MSMWAGSVSSFRYPVYLTCTTLLVIREKGTHMDESVPLKRTTCFKVKITIPHFDIDGFKNHRVIQCRHRDLAFETYKADVIRYRCVLLCTCRASVCAAAHGHLERCRIVETRFGGSLWGLSGRTNWSKVQPVLSQCWSSPHCVVVATSPLTRYMDLAKTFRPRLTLVWDTIRCSHLQAKSLTKQVITHTSAFLRPGFVRPMRICLIFLCVGSARAEVGSSGGTKESSLSPTTMSPWWRVSLQTKIYLSSRQSGATTQGRKHGSTRPKGVFACILPQLPLAIPQFTSPHKIQGAPQVEHRDHLQ